MDRDSATEETQDRLVRPKYTLRQRGRWWMLSVPQLLGEVFILTLSVLGIHWFPGWWAMMPGVVLLCQVVMIPVNVAKALEHMRAARASFNSIDDQIDDELRTPGDDRPRDRYQGTETGRSKGTSSVENVKPVGEGLWRGARGWYFQDDADHLQGPYPNRQMAQDEARRYAVWLGGGDQH